MNGQNITANRAKQAFLRHRPSNGIRLARFHGILFLFCHTDWYTEVKRGKDYGRFLETT